jgi:hypothetical protein
MSEHTTALIDRYPGLAVRMGAWAPPPDFTHPAVRHAAYEDRASLDAALREAWRQHRERV